jgi:RHS repeat-associated protein
MFSDRHLHKTSDIPSSSGNTVQDLSYTYDALGNITQIVDASQSSSSKTTYYTYDTLSRLLTASTTGAVAGADYKYTYAYDALGNITSGPLGSYSYAGSGGSSYANPDAATAVASKNLTYDNNGNLTAIGSTTYSWNYRNRLTQSGNGVATSTYGYDDTDARVWLKEGNTKTIFPNALYNVALGTTTATSTKHIMVGDMLIATVESVGTTTTSTTTAVVTKRFAVTDHLGSVSAMLTASGAVAEMLDAYPYGGSRLDVRAGSYVGEKNKYAQTQYDATANLDYAQARYQDGVRGQFLSQDPMFLGTQQNLTDPQSLNSYSYANDNPVNKSDPNGLATVSGTSKQILAQLKTQLLSASAFLASLSTSGGRAQFANNVVAGAQIVRSNPGGVAIGFASGVKQGFTQTAKDLYYGDDATQDKALASSILFFASLPASEYAAGKIGSLTTLANGEAAVPQVLINKAAGDALRDSVAATLRDAGYDVQTEVYKPTGLGARFIDIDVSKNGVNLGGVETKVGSSQYTPSQRAKDAWLKWTSGYIVSVLRQE